MAKQSNRRLVNRLNPDLLDQDRCESEELDPSLRRPVHNTDNSDKPLRAKQLRKCAIDAQGPVNREPSEKQIQELLYVNRKWAERYKLMTQYYKVKIQELHTSQMEHSQHQTEKEDEKGEEGDEGEEMYRRVEAFSSQIHDKKETTHSTQRRKCGNMKSESRRVTEQELNQLRMQNTTLHRRGQQQHEEIQRLNLALKEALENCRPAENSGTKDVLWRHQAQVYKEDFMKERRDREKLHEKHLKLETKFRKCQTELRTLKPQDQIITKDIKEDIELIGQLTKKMLSLYTNCLQRLETKVHSLEENWFFNSENVDNGESEDDEYYNDARCKEPSQARKRWNMAVRMISVVRMLLLKTMGNDGPSSAVSTDSSSSYSEPHTYLSSSQTKLFSSWKAPVRSTSQRAFSFASNSLIEFRNKTQVHAQKLAPAVLQWANQQPFKLNPQPFLLAQLVQDTRPQSIVPVQPRAKQENQGCTKPDRKNTQDRPTLIKFKPQASDQAMAEPDCRPRQILMYDLSSTVPYLTHEQREHMENHIRRKLIQRLWGIPNRITCYTGDIPSLSTTELEYSGDGRTVSNVVGGSPLCNFHTQIVVGIQKSLECDNRSTSKSSNFNLVNQFLGCNDSKLTIQRGIKPRKSISLLHREWKQLEMFVRKKNLEIKLGQLPFKVVQSQQECVPVQAMQNSKQPMQITATHTGPLSETRPPLKRQEVSFMSQDGLRRLEQNLTQKYQILLQGASNTTMP